MLLCGLDIGINYIVDQKEAKIVNALSFNLLVYAVLHKQNSYPYLDIYLAFS